MKTENKAKTESKVNTTTMLRRLIKSDRLDSFLTDNSAEMNPPEFSAYIRELCAERGLSAESIIRKADIDRTYGHQLFNGLRRPSRDKVLQLALAFGFSLDETQKLLRIAGKNALYPRVPRDAALIFAISHRLDVQKTQETLFENGITLLGRSPAYEEL